MSQTRTLEIVNIPVDKIKPSPYQPRLDFDLEELRGSIIQYGIRDPLKVRKVGDYWEIIDGERRWRIAQQEGVKTVPCLILDYSDEEADALSWRFNIERKDYSVEEKAKHFQKHQREGMSARAIARIHGYNNRTVGSYLSIFRLPEKFQNYIWAGEFSFQKFEYLYEKGLLNGNAVAPPTHAIMLIQQSLDQDLKQKEFEQVVDDFILDLKEKQVESAKKATATIEVSQRRVEKAKEEIGEPEVKEPETSEEFEEAARVLREEAKKRKTPEQILQEKREKARNALLNGKGNILSKLEKAKGYGIDTSKFEERFGELKVKIDSDPEVALKESKELKTEIDKAIKAFKEEESKRRLEEELSKRLEAEKKRIEEEVKKRARGIEEAGKHRIEEEARKKAKEELFKDRTVLKEAAVRYSEVKRTEREEARSRLEQSVLPIEVTEADLVHKVIIGDAKDVLRSVPASSIDMVVTSPPYFGLKEYEDELGIDTEDLSRYLDDLKAIFKECFRVLKDGTFICVVIGQYTSEENSHFIPAHVARILEEIGFNYKREHIWVKPLGIQGIWNRGTTSFLQKPYPRNTMINIHHEHILIYQKGDKPTIFYGRNPLTEEEVKKYCWSVWELYVSDVKDHPAPYPESIPYRLIKMYSYEGEVVLDPFLGSGTTMKVAKSLKRRSIGIEVSPEYLDIIKRSVGGADFLYHDGQKKLDFSYLTATITSKPQ